MARKDLTKNKLSSEQERHLIQLIEDYGYFEDLGALADYLRASRLAIMGFMKSTKAREARQRYIPGSREAIREARLPNQDQDSALPNEEELLAADGLHEINPDDWD